VTLTAKLAPPQPLVILVRMDIIMTPLVPLAKYALTLTAKLVPQLLVLLVRMDIIMTPLVPLAKYAECKTAKLVTTPQQQNVTLVRKATLPTVIIHLAQ